MTLLIALAKDKGVSIREVPVLGDPDVMDLILLLPRTCFVGYGRDGAVSAHAGASHSVVPAGAGGGARSHALLSTHRPSRKLAGHLCFNGALGQAPASQPQGEAGVHYSFDFFQSAVTLLEGADKSNNY